MNRRGWFAARIEREHYDTLFGGWKLRAWMDLNCEANHETGVVAMTEREMVDSWNTSKGSVGRWLAELADAGYVRMERLGDTPRAGRSIVIVDISDRGNRRGKPGAENGANGGVKKASGTKSGSAGRGARSGAIDGAKLGQSVGHVEEKDNQELNPHTVPTEPTPPAPAPPAARPALVLVGQTGNGDDGDCDDPDRMTAAELLGEWIRRQPVRPSDRDIGRQAAAAKRLTDAHPRQVIAAAWWAIERRFPWARPPNGRSEPWDLMTLEEQFVRSVQYAAEHHPTVKQRREEEEFEATLQAMGYG